MDSPKLTLYFTLLIHNRIISSVSCFEWWKPLHPPPPLPLLISSGRNPLYPTTHLHPMCVHHPPAPLQCTPNTKTHPHWCVFIFGVFSTLPNACWTWKHILVEHPHWCIFVFGIFSMPSNACWAWNNTQAGVFSFLTYFLCPQIYTEHEITPSLVCFHIWCLSYAFECNEEGFLPPCYCIY